MICPAEKIFQPIDVREALKQTAQQDLNELQLRQSAVSILQSAKKVGQFEIERAFEQQPFAARPLLKAYTYLTDGLVKSTLHYTLEYIHPLSVPTQSERIALIAVGGYGRGDMAPYSDVDLLFLSPYKITPWAESVIETMLYILWDLKLKVGYSCRTIKDCIKLSAEDFTIRTALLEQRFIDGDKSLSSDLKKKLYNEVFSQTGRDFIEAKLEEREKRHLRHGQRYMVEPNVKEGKGGLRDLQSLYWIAKHISGAKENSELVNLGVFHDDEYQLFVNAEEFLWAVRSHLHLLAKRPAEQLTVDLQVAIAERMGYVDRLGRRGVEHFMQDYFRHATAVGDLTRIFLTDLEAKHVKSEPLLEKIFRRRPTVKQEYSVVHNRLSVANKNKFFESKLNILGLFEEALRTGMLIHPEAMRLVRANLHIIDDDMRTDKEANRSFLDLLLKHGNPERVLRRMNELHVLSTFIPEFESIVAMMQFNLYHSYTVDEHTIQCIAQLAKIEKGELIEDLPVASSILKEGVNRRVLYIALLLHDIGKGREEDHSQIGAQIARRIAPRLGLKKTECETVEWLVRYHLLMSDMAQKRDIADPRTIRDFCKAVQTVQRLNLLCVLTVCDIRGVAPNTWNNWKAALLRALYRQTRRALENGMTDLSRENRSTEARKALRNALKDWSKSDLKFEIARHYEPYWQGLHVTAHVDFAHMLRKHDHAPNQILINLFPDEARDATRACFVMSDHPGIFARIAGALALVGANVVDARSYTTKDGNITDTFWLQDSEGKPYEASRLPRLSKILQKTLKGEVITLDALKSRDKIKKRERVFNVPTHITFDNEGSEIYTIIEVDTRDRPGLLYDLARTLAVMNVYVATALIATYGEQVVDTFYVKDMFGLKYHAKSKQKMLEKRLRQAIAEGAERASN
ncbi:MAG: [protein-PII] uridylyltransferase [Aestuariivita sp.]|nr:[protein-PII] uridylyltransferase [Aestuariivita sp.]